jgi:hypothetical protein
MPRLIATPRAPAWQTGDRAIVQTALPDVPTVEATVTELFAIGEADANRIRIKYPWVKPGDRIVVLVDGQGRTYRRLASDPDMTRIVAPTTRPTDRP